MSGRITRSVLGCKVNYADTERLASSLPPGLDFPVAFVGTCCVTAEGEKQSRKEVRRAVRTIGGRGPVFVAGCAACRDPAAFSSMGENVFVLKDHEASLAGELAAVLKCDWQRRSREEGNPPEVEDQQESFTCREDQTRTRYFLKVQDGCASGCSYCVIPLVRGRPRSITASAILREARAAIGRGYPEIVVTGIDAGAWRDGGYRLPWLLEQIAGVSGLKRLRLSSIEVRHVSAELIDVFQRHDVIGRHLHVPLQSGDDRVLKSMGRRYGIDDYLRAVGDAREALPGLNLTTDLIVGFPAEDDAAFGRSLEAVRMAGFSKVHVFSYSSRPGTPAESLGDPVSPQQKKERSRVMRELSNRQGRFHMEGKLGSISEVLLESALRPGVHRGYSSDYTRFIVEGGLTGSFARVRAEAVNGDGVMGKLEEHG